MRSTHRTGRALAAAAAVVALLLLATLVTALAAATPAAAATRSAPTIPATAGFHETAGLGRAAAVASGTNAVVRFQDYTLPEGQTTQSVVVIHGNALIAGTVLRSVVVVDGNATIESTAVVGAGEAAQSSSVVVVGGHLTTEPGATIHGKTVQVVGFPLGGILRAAASNASVRPIGVIAGWWQLLFLPIVALVVSALFPRAVRRVGDRVRLRFWPSLGWGLLGLLIVGVLLVVLTITIIGILVVVPAVIVLPPVLLFCSVSVAALLGRLVLSSSERYRDNIIAAAVVGAVLISLASLVPVIGGLAVMAATMAGFGATLFLVNEWRQTRHGAPTPAPAGPQPPSGWTPPPTPPQAPFQTPPPGWAGPQAPPPPGWAGPQGWTAPPGWPPPGWPQQQAPAQAPPPGWQGPQGWTAPPGTPPPEWAGPQGWGPGSPPPGWPTPADWPAPPVQGAAAEAAAPAPSAGEEPATEIGKPEEATLRPNEAPPRPDEAAPKPGETASDGPVAS
jgi:hypothetical protein